MRWRDRSWRRRQLLELRQDPLQLGGIGDAQLKAARRYADAAGNRDLLVTQDAADAVAQIFDHGLHHRRIVDFEQDVRAALQVEAKHDGARRDPFRQMRDQGLARIWAKQARHDDENRKYRHGEDGGDLPRRETQHGAAKYPGGWRESL